jgi:hypothetical protein
MKAAFKEIALQAGGSHYPDVGGALLEQFAELVVKECIAALDNTDRYHVCTTFDKGQFEATVENAKLAIKKRFES